VSGSESRLSGALTAHSLLLAGLSAVHSLRARGLRRTLLFAALGSGIPVLGELLALNVLRVLRHHARPQAWGLPLAIALGWYNVGYGTFAVMESFVGATGPRAGERCGRALAPALASATALAATSLDLLLDPCGLELGLWEWSVDGPYASEVEGPNGRRGVPLLNFGGWICLIASVALAYQRLAPGCGAARGPKAKAGRGAALLLLSYYLPAAAWTLKQRRPRHLIHSAPFAVALWAALRA
jgi:uncharacterized membrane protein